MYLDNKPPPIINIDFIVFEVCLFSKNNLEISSIGPITNRWSPDLIA